MTRPVFNRIALALGAAALVLSAAAPLSAQSMEEGGWTGTLTGPGGEGVDVTFTVAGEGENLAVTMHGPEGQSIEFDTAVLDGDALHLEFAFPGADVTCDLEGAEDGSYAGDCIGSDGQSGHLEMRPPADG
ncbi:MAG: hypothetical protein R3195_16465 [Gemmatimonadota bacterium]|nr:hypothetical protein [Gemmatimonadota bacterium]